MNLIHRIILFFLFFQFTFSFTFAQTEDSTAISLAEVEAYMAKLDSIEKSFQWQEGTVEIGDGLATIQVPDGYKYLNPEQSSFVLTDLWGNPPSEGLGMLFPVEMSPLSDSFTYAIEISYDEEGYIEDDDAGDLDYDELLEEMQSDMVEANEQREAAGYEAIELVGWATPPYYDAANKKLHWAKEIKFGSASVNTLNYNIRVLGRKGYLTLNAIGDIDILPLFQADADKILASVDFNEGNRYADFNPDIDEVAAYGIGGLIAGKILAKAGFFGILAKFGKFIIFGIIALFAALRKKLFGKKEA